MVGRPRQFDEDHALDAAMRAFWTKGYEATSLSDLTEATGLHRGSLYQAFGDKHQLFVRSLKRYLAEMRRQKAAAMRAAPTPVAGIRLVSHAMVDMADDDHECPKGCMALNAVVEMGPHDPVIQQLLTEHTMYMRQSLTDAIAEAQAAGEVDDSRSPEILTGLLMTFMAGLATTMKAFVTKDQAHRLLDEHLDAIF